jgi:hypothetical protein
MAERMAGPKVDQLGSSVGWTAAKLVAKMAGQWDSSAD